MSPPDQNLDHVLREITRVMEAGERIDTELYFERYPNLAPELKRFFDEQGADDDDSEELRPGTLIDDYRIRSVIGRGGMGVVYEAEQASLKRTVALKVLRPGATKSLDRFKREASAIARLSHPRIVAVHGFNTTKGLTYLAMERVHGLDLAEIIDRMRAARTHGRRYVRISGSGMDHPASGERRGGRRRHDGVVVDLRNYAHVAAALAADAADALRHAHAHGVIHRDIKPSNLIVAENGRVKLSDFGLAKTMEAGSITKTGDFVGSPQYVSPEQASSRRVKVDERADVYSLGVTLYELLTLHQPFAGKNVHVVLKQILTRTPPEPSRLNPRIPRDLETIVMRAIEKDPSRRYPSAEALGDDLRRFLNYEPIAARPLGPWGRLRRFVSQRPAAAALVTMAVIIMVLAGTLLLQGRGPVRPLLRSRLDAQEAGGASEILEQARRDADPGRRFDLVDRLALQVQGALERGEYATVDRLVTGVAVQARQGLWSAEEDALLQTHLGSTKVELVRRVTRALEAPEIPAAERRRLLGLVERRLEDHDPRVTKSAAMALGRIGDTSSLGALLDALSVRDDIRGRIAIVRALATFGDDGAVSHLVELTHAEDPELRFAALDALDVLDPPALEQLVVHLGRDDQSWIRHRYRAIAARRGHP